MSYRETAPPRDLAADVACIWVRQGSGPLPPALPIPAVDVLTLPDGRIVVAGPELVTRTGDLPPGGGLVGFRLRPGGCPALFGVGADEVPVGGVPLDELVGTRPGPALATLRALARGPVRRRDTAVAQVMASMRRQPATSVAAHACAVGLSERQLRRRFTAAVGLGPKSYLRLRRLHAVLGAARGTARPSWAGLAAEHGFYDQPHMLAEFRRTVGSSPEVLIRSGHDRFFHDGSAPA